MYRVLYPTEAEAGPFIEGLEGLRAAHIAGRRAFTGTLNGMDVDAVICGIGQANAAQAAASILEAGGTGLIVLAGCAGAYHGSGISVGDVAVAAGETYADTGVDTPGGFLTLEEAGIALMDSGGRRYYGSFPLRAAESIDRGQLGGLGFTVSFGGFLTVSTVSGTRERGDALFRKHGSLCENMEGAAVAQVALLYGAPFLEIRGISNMVEDRDRDAWDIPRASGNCATAVKRVIQSWKA